VLTKNGSVEEREHAWDVTSNIIFVDSPVNVGYSYSDDPRDRVFDEKTVAADLLDFLEEFLLGERQSPSGQWLHPASTQGAQLERDLNHGQEIRSPFKAGAREGMCRQCCKIQSSHTTGTLMGDHFRAALRPRLGSSLVADSMQTCDHC